MEHQRLGKYVLMEKITTGGMAEVYRAVATGPAGFARTVAIKRILPCYADSPEFNRMFLDEATIASRLSHANIAQLYEFDVVEGVPYIAMEFVEGKDVRAILQKLSETGGPFPYPLAVFIALETAKGLYYVHSRREASRPLNIVHRDVTPANIMVSHSGEVKIVDFGIARAVNRSSVTSAGTVKGKYAYMSPEQVMGRPLDHRTDVFSLGVVLWEMLTVKRLFAGRNEAETIGNVLRCRAEPPHKVNPNLPAALSPLVLAALARDRNERYPNMLAMYEALSRFLFDSGAYPDMGKLSQFLHGLFPEEMEKLAAGEHLAFGPPPGRDTEQDRPPAGEEITSDEELAGPDALGPLTEEETATAPVVPEPMPVVRRPELSLGARIAGLVLALAVIALLGVLGVQLVERVRSGAEERPGAQPLAAAGQEPDSGPRAAARPTEPARPAPAAERGAVDPGQEASAVGHAWKPRPIEAAVEVPGPASVTGAAGTVPAVGLPGAGSGPAPAAAPEMVMVTVLATPEDAQLKVNGEKRDLGEIPLRPGEKVSITLNRGGYQAVEDTFVVQAGARRTYALRKQSYLTIKVKPKDARVTVNGRKPEGGKGGEFAYTGVLNDTVTIRGEKEGYQPGEEQFTLRREKDTVEVTLRKEEVAAAEKTAGPSFSEYGLLNVNASPYATVTVDRKSWGDTPVMRQVAPGKHKVKLRYLDQSHTCDVTVPPGGQADCIHDFGSGVK